MIAIPVIGNASNVFVRINQLAIKAKCVATIK